MQVKKYDYFIGAAGVFAFLLLMAELSPYFGRFLFVIKSLNLAILLLFVSDVCFKFLFYKNKKEYFRHNWFDLIIFVPLVQFIRGIEHTPFFIISWQFVIVSMLISRLRKINKFIALLSLRPAQLAVASFAFAILAGTVLLMLPAASHTGGQTSFADALFTATSATCVTGLAVVDTGTHFSIFGQLVILCLIQIGGLGIMTFSVSVALFLKQQVGMQQEAVMQDMLDQEAIAGVKRLILFIVKMTLILETLGALLLFITWLGRFPSVLQTGYAALFHSVSAFCNAGFSIFSDNLMGFKTDIATNVIICLLIVCGGLGFTVIKDLTDNFRDKFMLRHDKLMRFRLQTKTVLMSTIFLIVSGALLIFFLEGTSSFSLFSGKEKVLASFFQSVAARTAGFNTVDIGRLSASTLLVFIALMFVGAAPGSTAGGVKVTTFAVLWSTLVASFKQKEEVELFRRTVPADVIKKAVTLFVFSALIVFAFALILLYTERKEFLSVFFETVSAFGTVGLSTGLTPALTEKGKLIISLLMFIGRLGPLAIAYAVIRLRRPARYAYAEERMVIG